MNKFPTLTEMGISHPEEISDYVLRTEGEVSDTLKIIYKRGKGSFLPQSRTYKFGRAANTLLTDSATSSTQRVHEISPFLQLAIVELDTIVNAKRVALTEKDQLLSELLELEQSLQSTIADIRARIVRLV